MDHLEQDSFAPDLDRGVARAIVELSQAIGSEWDSSIRRILKFDADLLRVERVNYWTFCADSASIHCDAGYVASVHSFEHGATLFEADIPEYFAALRTARVLGMDDVRADPRCRGLQTYCTSREISSMLDIPVSVDGRLCGVLCHEHVGPPRHWTEREEDFATSMGQVVASALSSSAHARAEGAARRAAFLDAFERGLRSLDAREVADRAVSMVARDVDAATLWMTNRDGVLECVAFRHRDPEKQGLLAEYLHPREAASRPPPSSSVQRVVRQGQSLFVPDVDAIAIDQFGLAPEELPLEKLAFRAFMVVPLTTAGKTLGAMTFAAEHGQFSVDDLALAEDLAERVASALENARLYEVARDAVRARDELLAVTAHELRTPLTALRLRTDHQLRAAERGGDPSERARSQSMARDVRRFTGLVDHMLDGLAVLNQGVTLARSSCDLVAIVREAAAGLAKHARDAGSTISVTCSPSITGCWDREQLKKVVYILIDNAIKFGEGRPVDVSARGDVEAELTIRDHGTGIASERLSAIFDPFGRSMRTEHFGGLGLGLYIARAIVEAHGGTLLVSSRLGEGSTFVMRLPRE